MSLVSIEGDSLLQISYQFLLPVFSVHPVRTRLVMIWNNLLTVPLNREI